MKARTPAPTPNDQPNPDEQPQPNPTNPTPYPYPAQTLPQLPPDWWQQLLEAATPGQGRGRTPLSGLTPTSSADEKPPTLPRLDSLTPTPRSTAPTPATGEPRTALSHDQEQAIHDRLHSRGARLRAGNRVESDTGLAMRQMLASIKRARARLTEEQRQEQQRRDALRSRFLGECAGCLDTGDDLDAGTPCRRCQRGAQKAAAAADREAERRRDARAALIRGARIPQRFWRFSLDTYPVPTSPALRDVRRVLARWNGEDGLILWGEPGRGKTALMVSSMLDIAGRWVDTTHRMLFTPSVSMFEGLRAGFGDETYADQLGRLCSVRLLCIDDLARESLSEWARGVLFDVINTRYNAHLPVFLTTNHSLDALAARIGEATLQRLEETCYAVHVTGPKLRTAKQLPPVEE